MNAAVGESAVLLSLIGAVVGVATLVTGLVKGKEHLLRAGRSYTWVILLGAVVATAAMEHALITRDFSMAYVANNDSLGTPLLFRITAMWSALQGSVLLWALVLSGYVAAVAYRFRKRTTDPLVGWATVVLYVVVIFFFGLMLTVSNPFSLVHGAVPTNGPGPDPLLQDYLLVAFHPPMVYLGLVGFTVPFAFAIASLVTGRLGEGWMIETRRWTLAAWMFLTAGLILGGWWSYQVLGWGGYWAWDPVENAVLLPWLTGTAYLHSVVVQERRGMLRVWNLSLLLSTFSLTILCTFLTRSGVLASVHSFTESDIGPFILGFFAFEVAVSVGLMAWRGDRLRSPGSIDSPVSREGSFLVNNFLFAAFALVVLLGTVFPLIVQAVNGSQITVGAPYFNELTLPISICLLFMMAVAPVLPWRKASSELIRHRLIWPAVGAVAVLVACVTAGLHGLAPLAAFSLGAFAAGSAIRHLVLATRRQGWRGLVGRSGGGMIVHLGVVIFAVAFAASHSYAHQTQLALRPGQTGTFEGNSFKFLGMRTLDYSNKTTLEARIRVNGGQVYTPAVSEFPFASEAVGTPSIRTLPTHDIYLTMGTVPAKNAPLTLGVIIEPLVMWVWISGGVMVLGTILAGWPARRRRRPADNDRARGTRGTRGAPGAPGARGTSPSKAEPLAPSPAAADGPAVPAGMGASAGPSARAEVEQ